MNLWIKIKRAFKGFGPGFVTGAADDDPSGIATYSITGAKFGYKLTWMSLFLMPAMISIQEMCGRIGMLSGMGLAGVIKKYYSRKVLVFAVMLLAVANIINIGADLGIMAASLTMLFGWDFYMCLAITATVIIALEVFVSYRRYSGMLKWLGLSLLVYVFTAFIVKHNWGEVAFNLFIPRIEFRMDYIMTMVGFLGTTISPYLFFWQASEEVEEEIMENKISDFGQVPRVNNAELSRMRTDTIVGMVFSNMMSFFIIITAAATLHANGIFDIETPQQAASALRPLAGDFAYVLFAVGIIGIGLQSIPVLAGSLAYATADAFGMSEGLSKKFIQAKGFNLILVVATLMGVLINLLGINTMKALYYAAVVNGVVAVPLIAIIIKLSSDERIVGQHKTGRVWKTIAWATFIFMSLAVILMMAGFFVQ